MADVDCPRAKSWMTPCIARDGAVALADDGQCVGCSADPLAQLADLAERYGPAHRHLQTHDPRRAADILARMVADYVETKEPARADPP